MIEQEQQTNIGDLLEQLLGIVSKRRWWILLPACTIALLAIAFIMRLPDKYTAEAVLIKYQPVSQRSITDLVGVVSNADDVQSATREVLSRARLLEIISQFNLYAPARAKGVAPDVLVEMLRANLEVGSMDPTRPLLASNAFRLSFTAESPETAQMVTSRLTQLFIDESMKAKENQATRTTNFLKEQVEAARQKLTEQEQRLQDFKGRYMGELPEQQQANFQTLTDLRGQLQNVQAEIGRLREQRQTLEVSLKTSLAQKESERSTLLLRFTPRYAEVVKKDQEAAGIRALLEKLSSGSSTIDKTQVATTTVDPILLQLSGQVDANAAEMTRLSREETRLRTEIGQSQGRLNLAPVREQQLSTILRDYDLFKQDYTTLLNRQLQSQVVTNLEERQEGSQYRLIDPPSLPIRPSSPKRLKLSLAAIGAGIAVGVVLAFLLEFQLGAFYSEKLLKHTYSLPLIVGVPVLLTPDEERSHKIRGAFEWVAALVLLLSVCAAELYVYRHG